MKNINPYRMSNKNKNYLFKKQINELTNFHASKCKEYNKIIKFLGFNKKKKILFRKFTIFTSSNF